jgi:hypothetical protein
VSFPDRFELLEPLREDDQQTFRARERATGRIVEVHFLASEMNRPPQQNDVIEQGDHEGKRYVVTAPLDSAGAWRIRPAAVPPQPPTESKAEPGDFTRMFQLRQAPEPAPLPASKPVQPAPASQPGEFTRAFQRPAAAPLSVPEGQSAPGQAGDFTRMFQTAKPESVPQPPVATSHSIEPGIETPPAARTRSYSVYILLAIVLLCAIAVFVLVRLY